MGLQHGDILGACCASRGPCCHHHYALSLRWVSSQHRSPLPCAPLQGRTLYPLSRCSQCRSASYCWRIIRWRRCGHPCACCHQARYSVVKEPKHFTAPSGCPIRSVPLRLAATRSESYVPSVAIASLRPHAAPLPLGDHRVPDTPVSPGNGQIRSINKVQAQIPCIPRICIGLRGIWSLHLAWGFLIKKARQTD